MKLNVISAIIITSFLSLCSCATESIYYSDSKLPSGLKWNDMEIDPTVDTKWSISRSNSWVALTNYNEKSQVFLSWDGGMGEGNKENAILKHSENGQAPIEYPLESLSMSHDGENLSIIFSGHNNEKGSIKIPL